MKQAFILLSILFLFFSATAATPRDTLPYGVNLAGAEFGQTNMPGVYQTDYTYPTGAEVNYFASKGLGLIRLPFRWERVQHQLNGPLDTTELLRISSFLDTCAANNMQVILDMHNYGAYRMNDSNYKIGTPLVPQSSYVDVWVKLATYFKNKTNIYGYDIMNQPLDLGYYVWILAAQEVLYAIRDIDKSKNIIVEGEKYSLTECWEQCNDILRKIYDPSNKLIYEAHIFFDKDGVGNYPQYSFDSIGADVEAGVRRAKPFVEWLKKNNKRGMIGSYGIPDTDTRWLSLMDNFLQYLSANCVNATYWAAGPWWKNYALSVEPDSTGADKMQMQVLQKYPYTPCDTPKGSYQVIPQIYFYPNPVRSLLTIDQGNCNNYQSAEVIDAVGRRVYTGTITSNKNIINLSTLPPGVWIIILRAADGSRYTQKIVKQ